MDANPADRVGPIRTGERCGFKTPAENTQNSENWRVRKLPKIFAPKKRGPIRTTLKPIALT
jgi:hypothetical protein